MIQHCWLLVITDDSAFPALGNYWWSELFLIYLLFGAQHQPIRPNEMYSQCKCQGCVRALAEESRVTLDGHTDKKSHKYEWLPLIISIVCCWFWWCCCWLWYISCLFEMLSCIFKKETLLVSQFTIALPLYSVGGEWSPLFLPKTTPTHPQSPPASVKQQLMTVP